MAKNIAEKGSYPLSSVMTSHRRANNARLNAFRQSSELAINLLEGCSQVLRNNRKKIRIDFKIDPKDPSHKEVIALTSNGHKKKIEEALDCAFMVSPDQKTISVARSSMVFMQKKSQVKKKSS